MIPENCPHCGMSWSGMSAQYHCGTYPIASLKEKTAQSVACKEIARLRADASAASPSCDRCQSAHCCSVRTHDGETPLCVTDPDGSMPLWMPWTNADVQARVNPLHAEIDRLRAEAGRVVVPELTEYQTDVIASMEEDIDNDDFEAMKNHLKIGHVHELVAIIAEFRAHSVTSSRVLKDGEALVPKLTEEDRATFEGMDAEWGYNLAASRANARVDRP